MIGLMSLGGLAALMQQRSRERQSRLQL
jgi:hypothetical protein